MMYEIITNSKGTRQIKVDEEHLNTIDKYALFNNLIDSTGLVDDMTVEKLRLNIKALMEAEPENGELVDLCSCVVFHDNMKALGLERLIDLYNHWLQRKNEPEAYNAE